ncbi:MAG: molybdopterin-guanine dinucleotide biosynthesis protein B [Sulfurimicrobium sp.]|nr:molybdopterin-guanine dinucleotide biosynthesis protein B [Sulfurimicrobium sp.]MDP2199217.1 molybdopterin-guanine dinucleotide biosynthesis protein B [Sulfurimicrobium sp.]MDP2962637.1 molybdopterin-guanine dinucleotide biosynthesis protein B [Sulfurimicrobium sp.]MDZ7655752.1 molybdopterin-guanine dinucleotide biosynthesis protein B [Sulfurimicrobium sp.]
MKVFGLAGWSGSGKTTLLEKLIPVMLARGIRVSTIKQTHHDADLDQPGKDSYRHRSAGASEVLLASSSRWVLLHELRGEQEPSLNEHVQRLSPCDLVLVEGFKQEAIPKLEIYRPGNGKPLLYPQDPHIIAIASDESLHAPLPWLDLNQPEAIVNFILHQTGLNS